MRDEDVVAMHSRTRRSALLALLFSLLLVTAMPAQASAIERVGSLPRPTSMSCAVNAGDVIYMFGGFTQGELLDTIVEVDPAAGTSKVLEWRLPSPRKLLAAVWTGDAAYVIGGIGYDAVPMAEMLRFVPGEGVTVLEGVMPYGTRGVSAFWSGEAVYIMGNCMSASVGQGDIIRYEPSSNETLIIEDVLPIPGAGASCVWADGEAYVFGGRLLEAFSDMVIRYIPGEGAVVLDVRMPSGRFGTAAAWCGSRAYVFGGSIALVCGPVECVPTEYLDEVLVFDPEVGTVTVSDQSLPAPADLRAVVWTNDQAMVLGGETGDGPSDGILSFDPNATSDDEWAGRNAMALALAVGVTILATTIIWSLKRRREMEASSAPKGD